MLTAILTCWFFLQCVLECCPQTLLLATDGGVKLFSVDTESFTTIHPQPALAVHFRYDKKDIYFISNKDILYSYFSTQRTGQSEPIPTVRGPGALTSLAVDWLHFRLYYSRDAVYEAPLVGATSEHIHSRANNVRALAVDPYSRLLFFIEDHQLVSVDTESRERHQYKFSSHGIHKVDRLAVDHHRGEVLAVDLQGRLLVASNYLNTQTRLVYSGPELSGVTSLDMFDDRLVWASDRGDRHSLYSCRLSPDCHKNNLTIILESIKAIHDVKFYNALVQTPQPQYACDQLNCSHTCTVSSLYTVSCVCPLGTFLDDGGNICIGKPPPTLNDLSWSCWEWLAEEYLTALVRVTTEELDPLETYVTVFIVVCCVLMFALLTCGLCVLICFGESKISVTRNDSYSLTERNNESSSAQPD